MFNSARQNWIGRSLSWLGLLLTRAILLWCRAIPAPIWALVVVFVLFPGIFPGAIALGIHNLGILGRLMAEVNENLDQRPLIALRAQGTPAFLVLLYGVLPMTLTRFLAYIATARAVRTGTFLWTRSARPQKCPKQNGDCYILYRWEVCTRETVIVGWVGAGGLGRLLTEQLSSFDYRSVVVTLGCFVMLTFAVDWLSHQMRRSLR